MSVDITGLTLEQLTQLSEQIEQARSQSLAFADVTERGQGLPTLLNTQTMLQHYNITVRHNEMTKEMEIDVPGHQFNADTAMNAKLAHIKSLARHHRLNPSDIFEHLTLTANANSYHPVRDWINSITWDGQDRLPDYYATVELSEPNPMKEVMMRKWALSLVAALYSSNFSCEGVLTFSGAQGRGKTAWVEELIPREYRNVWNKDAVIIDIKNKDTLTKALGFWITELGEIDATFRRSDIEALKAFITEKVDIIRPPYERTANKYNRRTVFYATVNEEEFLQDTENRRFWVLKVERFHWGRLDPAQFWAQIRQQYQQLAGLIDSAADREANQEWGWFLSPQEREQMQELQAQHRTVDPVEEILDARIMQNVLNRQLNLAEQLNVTEILRRVGQYPISRRETTIASRWLRRHGFFCDRQKRYNVVINLADQPWTTSRGQGTTINFARDPD